MTDTKGSDTPTPNASRRRGVHRKSRGPLFKTMLWTTGSLTIIAATLASATLFTHWRSTRTESSAAPIVLPGGSKPKVRLAADAKQTPTQKGPASGSGVANQSEPKSGASSTGITPTITSRHVDSTSETITFNTAMQSITLSSGPSGSIVQATGNTMVLRRGAEDYTAQVKLQTANGQTTHVRVPVPAVPPVPVYWFGNPSGRRVYITIDDGWQPSQRVLKLMQEKHVPITAFLIENAIKDHLDYWKAFVKAGGVVEDHTVTHPWLTHLAPTAVEEQWQKPIVADKGWFQQTPTLGRPPYGDINTMVKSAANMAGLSGIVMWSAEFSPSNPKQPLKTWNGKPLAPGDIILLHWQPGLYKQLQEVLALCKTQNLVPAPLLSGLPQQK